MSTFLNKFNQILIHSYENDQKTNEIKKKFELYKQKILTIKFLNRI